MSFEDPDEDRTWVFDVTFLTSNWTCIFGRAAGRADRAAPELVQGCCSYGAHFTDEDDSPDVEAMAERLTADQWQFRKAWPNKRGGIAKITATARPSPGSSTAPASSSTGPASPAARAAPSTGRRSRPASGSWTGSPRCAGSCRCAGSTSTDDYGHVTSTVREWKRRDWGEGGDEFHWWCTDGHEAFVGHRPVYLEMRDEIIELVGEGPYESIVMPLAEPCSRSARTAGPLRSSIPHPAASPTLQPASRTSCANGPKRDRLRRPLARRVSSKKRAHWTPLSATA